MTNPYRGRSTKERKLAERVAREWAERRAAAEATEREVDLDRASAEAVEAWAREGTSKAANRFNAFDLQCSPAGPDAAIDGGPSAPAPGEPGGPADDRGVRRTRTGWRKILPGADDEAGSGGRR